MRLDDLNATLRIRAYYRKTFGRERSPAEICHWLDKQLVELDAQEEANPKPPTPATPRRDRHLIAEELLAAQAAAATPTTGAAAGPNQ